MPRTRKTYPAKFGEQLVALARSGRSVETYGAPRIHAELAEHGVHLGHKRIERLMKGKCLRGVSRRKFVVTAERYPRARPASDLVERNFYADAPNVLWVADITYVPTWAGFLYLAVVLDTFSRRIIRWAMSNDRWLMVDDQKARLVIDAMDMAVTRRKADEQEVGPQMTRAAIRSARVKGWADLFIRCR